MFVVSLLNVAFIPQLCLNAIQDFNDKALSSDGLEEESVPGLNIFEEESKESHEENKTSGENYSKIFNDLITLNKSIFNCLSDNSSKMEYQFRRYNSLVLTPICPPPDFI